ncbi:MAG: integrase domain-containing protein [Gammaproteobacteria bacterium]|nr:integrase domain-containing protein [Gammaproteobacteria bacterium]
MRDLNYDLKRLQAARDDGSHGTRSARSYALAQMANTLHDLGFKGLRATGLRRKHAVALVGEWKRQGRSDGTMKNRTAHLRWWAERIGRPGVVPSNRALGIANREYVINEDRSVLLDPDKLALVKDEHVAMALRLEADFGLRREEAIKFTPSRDDRGDRIRLKGSTTKGGRPRDVPVLKDSQRRLLDEARKLVGSGALIPPDRNYKQQLKVYEDQTRAAGLYRMHGLRHRYAQRRYEEITGWKSPAAGGPSRRTLTGARRRIDSAARRKIAEELGHGRASIVAVYIS